MHDKQSNDVLVSIAVAALLLLTLGEVIRLLKPCDSPDSRSRPTTRACHSVQDGSRESAPDASVAACTQTAARVPCLQTDIRFAGQRFAADPSAGHRLQRFCLRMLPYESATALVGMPDIPSLPDRHALAERGLELIAYVADGGWIARIEGRAASLVRPVSAFVPISPELRIAPSLAGASPCRDMPVYVHVVRGAAPSSLLDELHDADAGKLALSTQGPFTTLAGRIPVNRIATFKRIVQHHPAVQYVEAGSGAHLLNSATVGILQSAVPNGPVPFWNAGIYGSNQVIAVIDTGLDVDMPFFRDASGQLPPVNRIGGSTVNPALRKVIAADFLYAGDDPANAHHWDNQDHGTFVCGCAAGSDINAPFSTTVYNGMAPAAKLIIQDGGFVGADVCADLVGLGCPVTNFYPALSQAIRQGAIVHNNSWGDNENGTLGPRNAYTVCSRELDLISWSNRQFLVVCAAGNDGQSVGNNSVASPSTAKNSLSVAACNPGTALETIAAFSSRGWTDDGRFKPDLAAPGGHSIRSANSDGDITTMNGGTKTGGGTSYASPMIAGMAAIVRDYFQQGFYPTGTRALANSMPNVSAALVKAVLIHSAQNMTGTATTPPARDQGWGRVNLSNALPLSDASHTLRVIDNSGAFDGIDAAPFLVTINVTSTNQRMKVTLVWTDYPSTPGADKHLVNDLDLLVMTRSGEFRGNGISNGWSIVGSPADRTNNVEQVVWWPDNTGVVQVAVAPFAVPQPTQGFAVVISGGFVSAPNERDEDDDGLPDAWELANFPDLSRDGEGDADGDGASNRDEFVSGTSPVNAGEALRITGIADPGRSDQTVLVWESVTNRTYQLTWRSNLLHGTWIPMSSNIAAPGPRTTVTVDTHRVQSAYYRVKVKDNSETP